MRLVPAALFLTMVSVVIPCVAAYEDVPCSFEPCEEGLGTRVDLLSTAYCEFASDVPFYIAHRWWQCPACFEEQSEEWICAYIKESIRFELTVDGRAVDCDFICIDWEMNDTPGIGAENWRVRWVYTSASLRLTVGIHLLKGTWTAPYPELPECRANDHPEETLTGTHVTTIAILHP